jgi:hypothetical protein
MNVDDLIDRVNDLPDDRALEAVNLLAGEVMEPKPEDEILEEVSAPGGTDAAAMKAALQQASAHERAALARVVLVYYGFTRSPEEVDKAIDATGRKAFILEAVGIGILALGLVHLVVTKGKKEQVRETSIEVAPDGKVTVKVSERTVYYSVGETLAPLLEGFLQSLGA